MARPEIVVEKKDGTQLQYAMEELKKYANGLWNTNINLSTEIIGKVVMMDNAPTMSVEDKWEVICLYADVQETSKASNASGQNYLLYKYVEGTFDCYCLLVDYDKMGLPWPDGFDNPFSRVNGQAPIAVNDNYLFYAKNNKLRYLGFGQCAEMEADVTVDGVSFNKTILPIAEQNEALENKHASVKLLIQLIEYFTAMKHGNYTVSPERVKYVIENFEKFFNMMTNNGHVYALDSLGEEEGEIGRRFPYKFCVTKDKVPTDFERVLDDLIQ